MSLRATLIGLVSAIACGVAAAQGPAQGPAQVQAPGQPEWRNPTLKNLRGATIMPIQVPAGRPGTMSVMIQGIGVVDLTRESVWVDGAVVEIIGPGGARRTVPAPEANTYRGFVRGVLGSEVRASLGVHGFRAQIDAPGLARRVYIEPTGDGNQHVAYTRANLMSSPGVCDGPRRDWPAVVDPAAARAASSPANFASGMAAAEVGIDSDFAFFLQNGFSEQQSLERMAAIIHQANAAYQDAGIVHLISYAIVRSDPLDPAYDLSNQTASVLHDEIILEWGSNYSDVPYDLVLMFTGRDIKGDPSDPGDGVLGQVNQIGSVCTRADDPLNSAIAATAWIQHYANNDTGPLSDADINFIVVHETGHLWSARHCNSDSSSTCYLTTPCKVMCNVIGGCDSAEGEVAFATCNAQVVRDFRDTRTCLDEVDSLVYFWVDPPRGVLDELFGPTGRYDSPFPSVNRALQGPLIAPGLTFPLPAGATLIITNTPAVFEAKPLVIDQYVRLQSSQGPVTIGNVN